MTTHFLGIGGIGMSALAFYLLEKGQSVSGSDLSVSPTITKLKSKGAIIYPEGEGNAVSAAERIVVSTAIQDHHPDLILAKALDKPILHRSDLLDELLSEKKALLVTGAHGKTSTSSLLAWTLQQASLKPSYIIGGFLKPEGNNSKADLGEHFVAEADESDGSFLRSEYFGAIITNASFDHEDFWKTEDKLQKAYKTFVQKAKDTKFLFVCTEDPFLHSFSNVTSYGFETGDLKVQDLKETKQGILFSIAFEGKTYSDILLGIHGKHQALNAGAVFGLSLRLGVDPHHIYEAFKSFAGVTRRFDYLGEIQGRKIFDDYAHHPREIKVTIDTFKSVYPEKKITAIFQPHRYSRAKLFCKEFAESLQEADQVVITNIHAAGEQEESEVLDMLCLQLEATCKNCHFLPKETLVKKLWELTQSEELLIFLGAGSIAKLSKEFISLGE